MAQETHSAFFSYAREDSDFVMRLAKDLKAAGGVVWLDQLDIRAGDHWDQAVEQALAVCSNMLLVLSPSSVSSTNVMDEVSFALEEGKLIIPVLYQTCKIPLRLRRLQYIDMRSDYSKGFEEVLRLVTRDENAQAERAALRSKQVGAASERVGRYPATEPAQPTLPSGRDVRESQDGISKKRLIGAIVAICVLALAGLVWRHAATTPGESRLPPTPKKSRVSGRNLGSSDVCIVGYVWREASPSDHVCVTPAVRDQTVRENEMAATRRAGAGPYGPDTCKEGYVWREAFKDDHVCVEDGSRKQAADDNSQAQSRISR